MPCSTDHYAPHEREIELNKAAKCYVWLVDKLNDIPDQPERKITDGMKKASKNDWGHGCGDTVAELCHLLNDIGEDVVKTIVGDNFNEPKAAELMAWNMKHKVVDKQARALGEIKRAVWTSSPEEIDGILEMNPELIEMASALIVQEVIKHRTREFKYNHESSDFEKAFMIIPDTNKFKRFINEDDLTKMNDKYKSVPANEKLTPEHYEMANVKITVLDVDCPSCGASKYKWCSNGTDDVICKDRRSFYEKTREYITRRRLQFPVE